jgi:cyclopropane fatty-acyl-phospholipid synthase-like methyltransferase
MNQSKINAKFFDTISPVYDKRTRGDWKSPSAVAAQAKPLLDDTTNLLDFGVGTGAVLSALDVGVNSSKIFAVDVASTLIDEWRRKFPAADVRQIQTACEIGAFGWPQFDVIVSSGVFEYIERIDSLISDLSGLLNRSGELIFTYQPIISDHPRQSDRETKTHWTIDYAKSVGLEITQTLEAVTLRWHAHEVYEFCRAASLQIVQHESFVAFYDLGRETSPTPRIYNLVRAKCSFP